jgi:hypothetical protein
MLEPAATVVLFFCREDETRSQFFYGGQGALHKLVLVTRLCMLLRDCGTTAVRTCCSVHNGVSAHSNKYILSSCAGVVLALNRQPSSRGCCHPGHNSGEDAARSHTERSQLLSLSVSLCTFLYNGILCANSSISVRVCRSSLLFWSCWKLLRRLDAAPVRGISLFLLLSSQRY